MLQFDLRGKYSVISPDLKMTDLLNIATILITLFTNAESFRTSVGLDCVICNARPMATN